MNMMINTQKILNVTLQFLKGLFCIYIVCVFLLYWFYFRFTELNLVDRCKRIEIRKADEEDICLIHFPEHFANLKLISELNDIKAYERYAEQYDSIYFNQV